MSARSFRSVFMVASCATAALGCYLVSLRVAAERAALERVETRIVLAQRDIRLLQTEIGTRGRLAQLERWNAKVLALSAPTADQFLEGGFALARLARPEQRPDLEAPVVLASAPADAPRPQVEGAAPPSAAAGDDRGVAARDLLRTASLKLPPAPAVRASPAPSSTQGAEQTQAVEPARAKTEASRKTEPKPKTEAARKTESKPTRTVAADPLAPLPGGARPAKPAKGPGQQQ